MTPGVDFFSLLLAFIKLYSGMASEFIGFLWATIKAKPLVSLGRFVFFALTVSQCFLLASYPAKYKDDSSWYGIAVPLYASAVIVWVCLVSPKPSRFEADLRSSFLVWGLYIVFGLIPSVTIVFGVTRAGLSSNSANATLCFCNATANHDTKTLGPVILKGTFCATPILLILLLNTANDARELKDVVYKLCVQLAVDLLDAVEMIDVVLDEQEHNYRISRGFGIAMITVACISFLLSLWPMIETRLEGRNETISAIIRNFVEIIVVNLPFLIIRLVIVFEYGKDESIFVAKNIIAIMLSVLEIRDSRDKLNNET